MPDLLADHVFCQLFIAHAADGRMDDVEIEAIQRNITPVARRLGHSDAAITRLVTEGIDRYWDLLADQGPGAVTTSYREAIQRLLAAVGQGQGAGDLVEGLANVAAADGHIDDMETLLIDAVVDRWPEQMA